MKGLKDFGQIFLDFSGRLRIYIRERERIHYLCQVVNSYGNIYSNIPISQHHGKYYIPFGNNYKRNFYMWVWIPAFAGMTKGRLTRYDSSGDDRSKRRERIRRAKPEDLVSDLNAGQSPHIFIHNVGYTHI